jgi:hypothetical protein
MDDETETTTPTGWDKGKAEAAKRFGQAKTNSDEKGVHTVDTPGGAAAGIAEARRRFGKTTKRTT